MDHLKDQKQPNNTNDGGRGGRGGREGGRDDCYTYSNRYVQ